MSHALFEVSWEVCNKVGGIYTVVSSKVPTLVERLGDDYVLVGPLLATDEPDRTPFDEEEGHEAFREACRAVGVEVRVGRWRLPDRPRTLLVGFSGLFEQKDSILAELWEHHGVDSLMGGWEYIEPVLFAHAAGIAIQHWWREVIAPQRKPTVAQFHEWLTAAGLLYIQRHVPAIGTVFTTHATMLGRSLASTGRQPAEALGDRTPEEAAADQGVRSKHSLEGVAARKADVFTTVSRITAEEAALFHHRDADPLLPNGLDLGWIDTLAGEVAHDEVRARLARIAKAVAGEDVEDAFFIVTSGRYEVYNKGYDILLRALGELNKRPGRSVVLFLLVPAGTAGIRRDVKERVKANEGGEPLGITTHDLIDPEHDAFKHICDEAGLTNEPNARVKIIHLPKYLDGEDGLLNAPYESVLHACDLSCYASFYEPWGYTPAESVAVGVPTITTNCAGFGRWAREQDLGWAEGVHVLERYETADDVAQGHLLARIETALGDLPVAEHVVDACRTTAAQLAWSDLIRNYDTAFALALEKAHARKPREPLEPQHRRVPITPQAPDIAKNPHLVPFQVTAALPEELAGLERLSRNLWWSWDPEGGALFRAIAPALWEDVEHNPVRLLRNAPSGRLAACAGDPAYLGLLKRVLARFDAYIGETAETRESAGTTLLTRREPVAYFCFEYAVHESIHIYAGGLGVLAGDHLKSASDLNLPLVAVGILFRQAYVEQVLDTGEAPLLVPGHNDPSELPLTLMTDESGRPLHVTVQFPDRPVVLQAWRLDVGRVPLYLLDSDVEANRPEDREITHRLYPGKPESRLQQEILLGKGGVRMLQALGLHPAAMHLNEGHAGFAPLERTSQLVQEDGLSPSEARAVVRATTAFTTHTPIPAGHDTFEEDLIRRYFGQTAAWGGFTWEKFLAFGRAPDEGGRFNMTYFSMSFASGINGVSEKHGEVSRNLLQTYWPGLLREEVPVDAITNGVHLATWTDPAIGPLIGRTVGALSGEDFATGAADVDPEALWEVRRAAKRRLFQAIDRRIDRAARDHEMRSSILERMRAGLDEDALVIGFARRLAPYKRADLLLGKPERLLRILQDADRPVRILFAGKAHPDDSHGGEILQTLVEASRSEKFAGSIYFLENYDMTLGRLLVQGVDVWLNNPIPPQEASGTSGMKAAANGGLNLSIMDGWWIEACDGRNGWCIRARGADYAEKQRDSRDASEIFTLLEDEVVPLFFDRDGAGIPHAWLQRAVHAMSTIPPFFNSDRMVEQYTNEAYLPLAANFAHLKADGFKAARYAALHRLRLKRGMEDVRILTTHVSDTSEVRVGDPIEASMDVDLGPLEPGDVVAELLVGRVGDAGPKGPLRVVELEPQGEKTADGAVRVAGRLVIKESGRFEYGLRVRPRDVAEWDLTLRRMVRWA